MNLDKLLTIANESGGTLYLMAILMLIALTVIIERTRHLLNMQSAGEALMQLLREDPALKSANAKEMIQKFQDMPHTRIIQILEHEPITT